MNKSEIVVVAMVVFSLIFLGFAIIFTQLDLNPGKEKKENCIGGMLYYKDACYDVDVCEVK